MFIEVTQKIWGENVLTSVNIRNILYFNNNYITFEDDLCEKTDQKTNTTGFLKTDNILKVEETYEQIKEKIKKVLKDNQAW